MKNEPLPTPPADENHLLEDLAATTGLFNPERIWQEEMLLDNLEQLDQAAPPPSPPPAD